MSKIWKDENGLEIPGTRVTKAEKLKERKAAQLLKQALKIHQTLKSYKSTIDQACQEVFDAVMEEAGAKGQNHKGNFTWYNFDRTIKVEVNINERIDFDDALIAAAKDKFYEFLSTNTSGIDEMIRSLIMDAFQTTRGKLDPKKVLGLVRYRSRINEKKYPLYHEAIDLIERSIRRPDSRKYFRIWERKQDGKYVNIDLNFSSI